MKGIKNRLIAFIKDEDGFELLQVAIVVLIVAVLAVAVWQIATNVNNKMKDAESAIDNIQIDLDNTGNHGNSASPNP